ncbi:MAG: prepilin-type N-terminal cleavage/methylation domain-containing protein [Deltaproteobacteria bacterium]|nr:prepilin-type N-terminal cleavage/methylation domain-containing protein [Deltaproteobacteria bacterium]MBT8358583.1 prepilin-type N-terminal cleavage/methylation domain-containing protein [Deltaproteobacteria bacterium]
MTINVKSFYTKTYRSNTGFTLLEIMVAISIIAIVLVTVYRMHAQTISMNVISRFNTVAPVLAKQILTQNETKTLDELADDSGDFGKEFTDYKWQVSVKEVESEALGEIAKDLKQIEVTVSLNEDEDVYTLRSYRFFR